MSRRYFVNLSSGKHAHVGNKGRQLRFLMQQGFRVPTTYACPWDLYQSYQQGDPKVLEAIKAELVGLISEEQRYAVRSSASLEDSSELSFAGQFRSFLDVQGIDQIIDAVEAIWSMAESERVRAYLAKNGIDPAHVQMAVLIQEMVSPRVSGVSFSRNPLTGLDEVVVEAVEGRGDALVQDGVTPQRWIEKWGAWVLEPEGARISSDLIQRVVDATKAIAKAYGCPVDLEWVYDGRDVHWVQLREITSLDVDVYSNHISREMFPGLIKPLVWSVNVPLVNGAWVRLFTELIGPNDIDPNSLAACFYHRAYFNMGAVGRIFAMLGMPRESLELMMGLQVGGPDRPSMKPSARILTFLPRVLKTVIGKARFSARVAALLPQARAQYAGIAAQPLDHLAESDILAQIDDLYQLTQQVAYYNIVTPLLMQIYNGLLGALLSRQGIDLAQMDITGGLDGLREFDPGPHLAQLHQEFFNLDPALQERVRRVDYATFCDMDGVERFRHDLERFIVQFGHLSDSGNDFSSVPWRETPELVVRMSADYTEPASGEKASRTFQDLKLPAWRRLYLQPLYTRARRFRLHREAVSSLYTYGYGLFRRHFLTLGARLTQRGAIDHRDNIMYLQLHEIRRAVQDAHRDGRYREAIEERKRSMERCRAITPPTVIYGDEPLPPHTGSARDLSGTPTSRGQYTGPVRVVRGIGDLDKVAPGDVLVVPYSDVGWTPLFAKAGAVVAESGGILSHSSIIAREYAIPAVVSVHGACSLEDGTLVTVDGYRGTVTVNEAPQPHRADTGSEHPSSAG